MQAPAAPRSRVLSTYYELPTSEWVPPTAPMEGVPVLEMSEVVGNLGAGSMYANISVRASSEAEATRIAASLQAALSADAASGVTPLTRAFASAKLPYVAASSAGEAVVVVRPPVPVLPAASASSNADSGLPGGAIAGIVIGSVVLALVVVAGVVYRERIAEQCQPRAGHGLRHSEAHDANGAPASGNAVPSSLTTFSAAVSKNVRDAEAAQERSQMRAAGGEVDELKTVEAEQIAAGGASLRSPVASRRASMEGTKSPAGSRRASIEGTKSPAGSRRGSIEHLSPTVNSAQRSGMKPMGGNSTPSVYKDWADTDSPVYTSVGELSRASGLTPAPAAATAAAPAGAAVAGATVLDIDSISFTEVPNATSPAASVHSTASSVSVTSPVPRRSSAELGADQIALRKQIASRRASGLSAAPPSGMADAGSSARHASPAASASHGASSVPGRRSSVIYDDVDSAKF
ncbi:hypothetical protein EON62_01850 [archaeon]|nr:MAG: hypothetical protein EON62_01850 [archaeon]